MSLRSSRILATLVVVSACLVFMTPQAGNSAQNGQITRMTLAANPNNYHGACPVTINFNGSITLNGPNTVTYAIERSDGGTGSGPTLKFASGGTKAVHSTWRLGSKGMNFNGWMQIASGNSRSNKAAFQIHCNK
jgi:hypothetical protein